MNWEIAAVAGLLALLAISYVVEALRSQPTAPERLDWAPDIPIRYVALNGTKLRYIVTGQGPALVLLHTLRTQLDMFQKVIPELAKRFQVYALDYPGHGYSDIPKTEYSLQFFVTAVARFLDQLDIRDAVIVGESIGGTIALVLAARRNPRVRSVVAINPYDYDRGRGLRRSSGLANLLFGLNNVPVLGATVTRLRQYPIVKRVLEGGVYRKEALRRSRLVARGRTRSRPAGDSGHRDASHRKRRAFPVARCAGRGSPGDHGVRRAAIAMSPYGRSPSQLRARSRWRREDASSPPAGAAPGRRRGL